MKTAHLNMKYVICVNNESFPASLERCKVYCALADEEAAARRMIRVVDESGEDYLYPKKLFAPVSLPKAAQKALSHSA